MADRDYILEAQAALGIDDHLIAMRRLQKGAARPAEQGEAADRRGNRRDEPERR